MHTLQAGIHTVRQREINDPEDAAERNQGLRSATRQRIESLAVASGQDESASAGGHAAVRQHRDLSFLYVVRLLLGSVGQANEEAGGPRRDIGARTGTALEVLTSGSAMKFKARSPLNMGDTPAGTAGALTDSGDVRRMRPSAPLVRADVAG